jgi:hypothetical protein
LVNDFVAKAHAKQAHFNYANTHVYETLDKYAAKFVTGKRGLVIGSENPWLEAILLDYGAEHVTTLEFGTIRSGHPKLSSIKPNELTRKVLKGQLEQPFDFMFSFSSLEHDGLGRYGDILNPKGDLQMMARLMTILKPSGLFFLGLPTDETDALFWNAHRVYGPLRYPLMVHIMRL